ncbi:MULTISPECIES: DUF4123 domain-containing protein [unclassified Vibrio]|uniref:DUF4123 domain-containing protein n=1 Tax=unclassified Vibrio TaxID=2614977 RepID=UPI002F3FAD1F
MLKQKSSLTLDMLLEHWLIVDTVRVPDVAELAYTTEENPELFKLYAGSPFLHLLKISPVVFNFTGSHDLAKKIKDDFALRTSSVVFSYKNGSSLNERINHLHNLMSVVINKEIAFFRYHSSEFWSEVSHHLIPQDIDIILGPFETLSWVDKNQNWNSISRDAGVVKTERRELPFHLNSPVISKQI